MQVASRIQLNTHTPAKYVFFPISWLCPSLLSWCWFCHVVCWFYPLMCWLCHVVCWLYPLILFHQLALSLCVDFVMSGVGFIPSCYHLALSSCVDLSCQVLVLYLILFHHLVLSSCVNFVMLSVGFIPWHVDFVPDRCLTESCAASSCGTRVWWRQSASAGQATPSAITSMPLWTATVSWWMALGPPTRRTAGRLQRGSARRCCRVLTTRWAKPKSSSRLECNA